MLEDEQTRGFLKFLVVMTVIYTLSLEYGQDWPFMDSLVNASFNMVSIVTTTGYVSTDYQLWGNLAVIGFFYLMFVGGCSGSITAVSNVGPGLGGSIGPARQLQRLA